MKKIGFIISGIYYHVFILRPNYKISNYDTNKLFLLNILLFTLRPTLVFVFIRYTILTTLLYHFTTKRFTHFTMQNVKKLISIEH